MESLAEPRRPMTLASRWKALGSTHRRRILLGACFALALAARDLVLLLVAAGLFALSEASSGRAPVAQAS